MSEHTNELSTIAATSGIVDSFKSGGGVYSSYRTDDFESKIQLASALSDSEPLVDHLGKNIELVHIVVQSVQLTDEDTGVVEDAVRTVLIDANGKAYSAISGVIVQRLRDIIGVLGTPDTWAGPVKVRVDRVKGKGKNFFYDLRVVTPGK